MRYMGDFDVLAWSEQERGRPITRLTRPFVSAVRTRAAWASLPAPFVKMIIRLEDPAAAYPSAGASLWETIATAVVPTDVWALASLTERELRPAVAELVLQGLQAFRARYEWDDAPLRQIVREAGLHQGPYILASRSLIVKDKAAGRTYSTQYEFSVDGTRILAVRSERDGTESATATVMRVDHDAVEYMFDAHTGRSFIRARIVRIEDGRLTYRTRERHVVTSISLDTFNESDQASSGE